MTWQEALQLIGSLLAMSVLLAGAAAHFYWAFVGRRKFAERVKEYLAHDALVEAGCVCVQCAAFRRELGEVS